MNEIWKPVIGYEKLYLISNYGNIQSICNNKSKFLKPSLESKGYLKIRFFVNNKLISRKIHRLVAEHFLLNYDSSKQINHIDGNKINNYYLNLECVNNRENCSHYNLNRLTSSNYVGVDYQKSTKKWRARIRINNTRINLGNFINEQDARDAYKNALIKYKITNKYVI